MINLYLNFKTDFIMHYAAHSKQNQSPIEPISHQFVYIKFSIIQIPIPSEHQYLFQSIDKL